MKAELTKKRAVCNVQHRKEGHLEHSYIYIDTINKTTIIQCNVYTHATKTYYFIWVNINNITIGGSSVEKTVNVWNHTEYKEVKNVLLNSGINIIDEDEKTPINYKESESKIIEYFESIVESFNLPKERFFYQRINS